MYKLENLNSNNVNFLLLGDRVAILEELKKQFFKEAGFTENIFLVDRMTMRIDDIRKMITHANLTSHTKK